MRSFSTDEQNQPWGSAPKDTRTLGLRPKPHQLFWKKAGQKTLAGNFVSLTIRKWQKFWLHGHIRTANYFPLSFPKESAAFLHGMPKGQVPLAGVWGRRPQGFWAPTKLRLCGKRRHNVACVYRGLIGGEAKRSLCRRGSGGSASRVFIVLSKGCLSVRKAPVRFLRLCNIR